MNSDKIVKIPSNEGGPFTNQNKRVSFVVPPNSGVYDLSKSYLEFNCSVSQADNNNPVVPIIDFLKEDGATAHQEALDNVSLIKNASMSCQNRGSIADIRRVDMLHNNFKQYLNKKDKYRSENYKQLVQPRDDSGNMNSIFREIRREGINKSKIVNAPVIVPLSDIFGFGQTKFYDSEKYGRTSIKTELNMDKIQVSQDFKVASVVGCLDLTVNRGADCKSVFITLGGTTAARMLRLEDVPVFVGQNINIRATAGGNASAIDGDGLNRTIEEIVLNNAPFTDANSGTVQIKFNDTLNSTGSGVLGGGDSYTGVSLRGVDNALTFSCDTADIVLRKVSNVPKMSDEITYKEFSTEEHTAGGVQNFQRQFQVEPEAINLYVVKADEQNSVNGANGITSYRLRIDNEDATDRDVVYRSPLYYDRLNTTFINGNNQVENLNEESREIDATVRTTTEYYRQANKNLVMVCNPMPMTPSEKLVQVNITSGAATLKNINLYKELVKSI
tara:strand:+ start:3722 stop:5224 length:1503 start_codon:yes stop_codon:yes gene_type:complete